MHSTPTYQAREGADYLLHVIVSIVGLTSSYVDALLSPKPAPLDLPTVCGLNYVPSTVRVSLLCCDDRELGCCCSKHSSKGGQSGSDGKVGRLENSVLLCCCGALPPILLAASYSYSSCSSSCKCLAPVLYSLLFYEANRGQVSLFFRDELWLAAIATEDLHVHGTPTS